MKNTVFIHTNDKQLVGAKISAYSLKRNSRRPDSFDVRVIRREDYSFFEAFEGRPFLRAGVKRPWANDDLQSFTPLRFAPPEIMGYQGRAVVIDPDIFAVGDVSELLERDMQGKAICAKPRHGHNGRADYVATSVMLLECAKLRHWRLEENFNQLFRFERDYEDWITLAGEPRDTIGFLEDHWNDFDRLTPDTRLLHNTKRRTQPWKTGLPIDFTNRIPIPFVSRLIGSDGIKLPLRYKKHPDARQEQFFFALLKECLAEGVMTESFITSEMARNHVRHDALEMARRAPALEAIRLEAAA
ncbi:MAG: hypothetical protein AB7S41_13535 [Parvibaculaceae bacterium]